MNFSLTLKTLIFSLTLACMAIAPVSAQMILIKVKSMTGSKNELEVGANSTIKNLKTILSEKEGMPISRLKLSFRGKELKNSETLKQRGIRSGMTIQSSMTLK